MFYYIGPSHWTMPWIINNQLTSGYFTHKKTLTFTLNRHKPKKPSTHSLSIQTRHESTKPHSVVWCREMDSGTVKDSLKRCSGPLTLTTTRKHWGRKRSILRHRQMNALQSLNNKKFNPTITLCFKETSSSSKCSLVCAPTKLPVTCYLANMWCGCLSLIMGPNHQRLLKGIFIFLITDSKSSHFI